MFLGSFLLLSNLVEKLSVFASIMILVNALEYLQKKFFSVLFLNKK